MSHFELKSLCFSDVLFNLVNLVRQLAQVHFGQLLVLQLFNQRLSVLFIDVMLELLDVAFIVNHALSNNLDIVRKRHVFVVSPCLKHLCSLDLNSNFLFKALEFLQVIILHGRVLHFDRIELLLVFLRALAEPGRKLLRFLGVKCFRVNFICLFRLENFVYAFFEAFVLDFGESDLILEA